MTRRWARAGLVVSCVGLVAGALAGCSSGARTGSGAATQNGSAYDLTPSTTAVPLSTSLVTAQGTWAIAVMGGSAAAENNFWQLFVRPPDASRWSLATPPGVADNGGLVAAGTGTSLVVGFRPSQDLVFSPLAASDDTGKSWTPGLLDAGLANVPDALATEESGQALALLQNGSVEVAATAGAATAGHWSMLTTRRALAASAPGRSCGLQELQAVSFGPDKNPMVAGSCEQPGVAGVFTDTSGTWRSAGLTLSSQYGSGQVQTLGLTSVAGGNAALLLAGDSLLAAWSSANHWTVSGPLAVGPVRASGFGTGGRAWLLLNGRRAETISGPGGSWQRLPAVPAGTATLAPGPGGSWEALAVSGSRLTVWQLTRGAWATIQLISVPIQYGSSS